MVFFRTSTDVAISSSSPSILISGRSRYLPPLLLLLLSPSLDCTHVYNVHTIHNVYNVHTVHNVNNEYNVYNIHNVYNVRSVHITIENANNVNYYQTQCMLLSVSIT